MKTVYRLTATKGSSEKYGACECCGRMADSIYHLTRYRAYTTNAGKQGMSYLSDAFGHKNCLAKTTEAA